MLTHFRALLAQVRIPSFTEIGLGLRDWVADNWRWWGISTTAHAVIFCILMLIVGSIVIPRKEAPSFEGVRDNIIEKEFPIYQIGKTSLEPSTLDTDSLMQIEPPGQTAQYNDDSPEFEEAGGGMPMQSNDEKLGGLGGFDVKAIGDGPIVRGLGGVGASEGFGTNPGVGGTGEGFGGRGKGKRDAIAGGGATKETERAVAAGLNWFARHQRPNGSWSINHKYRCRDGTCTGPGMAEADAAATAMALLPYLAAGQTHLSKGPYKETIQKGMAWLLHVQGKDGSLSAGSPHIMYSHGLATIALCEAYGMSKDQRVGKAAQAAIDFIEKAQNQSTGGWRYNPGDTGDTSVFGWTVMALKSGQMAGLRINYTVFQGVERWLKSVASGKEGGLFSYLPTQEPTPSMTSIGLLCHQYTGMRRDAPAMSEGIHYLMSHMPRNDDRDLYYWYYATQTMHNLPGSDWDTWNRAMRKLLVESQDKAGCATGSWDPDKPTRDAWGAHGGRHMMTSFATLTLEVYYRYLPLFKLDRKKEDAAPTQSSPAPEAAGSSAKSS